MSLCSVCRNRVDAKLVSQDGRIYMLKHCLERGPERVLVALPMPSTGCDRAAPSEPGQLPKRFNTKTERGCPWDRGICPDHEQHGCLTLVEITDRCNLSCPVCYADSAPGKGRHGTLQEVDAMLDTVVANEGEPDVVQGIERRRADHSPAVL
ncbi:MAG: hypothetical protein V9E86_07895 [Nitrosomonas sp.]